MAFLFGIVCGSIGKKTFGKSAEKKDGITCVIPMQSSSTLTIIDANIFDAALPEETRASFDATSAGLVTDAYRDMMPPVMTHGTSNPDSDIGVIPDFINTS